MATPHKHSAILKSIADGHAVEYFGKDKTWHTGNLLTLVKHPDYEWRTIQNTIAVNGKEFQVPYMGFKNRMFMIQIDCSADLGAEYYFETKDQADNALTFIIDLIKESTQKSIDDVESKFPLQCKGKSKEKHWVNINNFDCPCPEDDEVSFIFSSKKKVKQAFEFIVNIFDGNQNQEA